MALQLLKIFSGSWEQAKEHLRRDLQTVEDVINAYVAADPTRNAVAALVVPLLDQAFPAVDASLGSVFRLAAAGNRTLLIPTNPTNGQVIILQHYAQGANRTLSLNTSSGGFRFGTTFAALTATTAGKTDYIQCVWNAADNFWDILDVSKG